MVPASHQGRWPRQCKDQDRRSDQELVCKWIQYGSKAGAHMEAFGDETVQGIAHPGCQKQPHRDLKSALHQEVGHGGNQKDAESKSAH